MPTRDVALALFVTVLWGFNFVVMKHAVSEVPPLALTGIRFTMAALPAVFFIRRPPVPWRILLAFGAAFGVVKFGLLFTAFRLGMPVGLASLVLQLQAAFTIAMACVWFAERPTGAQWTGLGVALVGAALIMSGVAGGATLLPVLLTLAAAIAWGFANLAVKAAGKIDMLGFAAWTSLMPGAAMLAASLVVEGPGGIGAVFHMTALGYGALAYLIWPISLVSGAIWGGLLSRHPMAAIVPFALLVPVVGFVSGHLVYGETLTGTTAIGALLVGCGLVILVAGGRLWTVVSRTAP